MKKSVCFPVGLLLGLIILSGYALGEQQVVPPTQQLKKPPLVILPDLVLENLRIGERPLSSAGMYFFYSFRVTVKNIGTAPVDKPFQVAVQYFDPKQSKWMGENDKNNCFPVTRVLKPNESHALSNRVRFPQTLVTGQSLRVRALVDYACDMEFPPTHGQIAELNEDNNISNEVTIPASELYAPNLGSVSPKIAERGVDRVMLGGFGFGADPGDHTVIIQVGDNKVPIAAQSWSNGTIYFVVPASMRGGAHSVYIGEKESLKRVSNPLSITVLEKRVVRWDAIVTIWDLFKDNFNIRLNNWSERTRHEPRNSSWIQAIYDLKTLETRRTIIPLQMVEISTPGGHYRFLVNDMRSTEINLGKEGCNANQLRLDVLFESQGTEMIGYYRVRGPAGEWRRTGAPDVEINNAKLSTFFTFSYSPGADSINYSTVTSFNADIHSTNPVWNNLLDLFMNGWDSRVKNEVAKQVNAELNSNDIRKVLRESLMTGIRTLAFGTTDRTITQIRFLNTGIEVTFY